MNNAAAIKNVEQTLPISEDKFARLDLGGRLTAARAALHGRVVFTTSFGIEDQAIAHEIFSQSLSIACVTLDTGRLFQETHDVWTKTEQRYNVKFRAIYPDHRNLEALANRQGTDGFRQSVAARQSCCHVRKVEPLKHALSGAVGWITGLRANQSSTRAKIRFLSVDPVYKVIKINPLADWSREQVVQFVRDNNVPYNALHDRGFLSIGCAPCTRAVFPGEPERAGRWWWEQKSHKECGLHQNSQRATAKIGIPVDG